MNLEEEYVQWQLLFHKKVLLKNFFERIFFLAYLVYVIGKYIKETFKGLNKNKKAKILNNKFDIINLINNDLNNNDYLMIKGSNSTGLHKITNNLKQRISNAI